VSTRKSAGEPEVVSPFPFCPPSNGEFCPSPPTRRQELAEALWRRTLEEKRRRLGMSRRQFAESACGMASALWAINQVACGTDGSDAGVYQVDDGMLEDEERARVALSGDEFIFDVQTHVSEPLTPFDAGSPPERALDFIRQIFVESDTTVACLTGVPATRALGVGNVQARTQLSEIMDRLAGPRLVFHANADPENGAAELDYMSEVAESYPVAAWKTYPHETASRLDSEDIGMPFIERARALGINIIASHRGISGGGGYTQPGSPVDVVRAARAAPDVRFLIYHSGWENGTDENHAYDPQNLDPGGVDRLVLALSENQIDGSGNVYGELGSTWFNIMGQPAQAAHVIGKLLSSLGADRIVWGTDCVFNGNPQTQIAAFRAFQIPEAMQAEFGYPAITAETRARILGLNAAAVYGVDPALTRYAIEDDDVARLRSAFLHEPGRVLPVDPRIYEGPRTRQQYLALLARERQDKRLARQRRGLAPSRG
jgi:predicted TIM-barrel fold metal-dependent hydrolase